MQMQKEIKTYKLQKSLQLDCGAQLQAVDISYEIYGTLNYEKSNAILICHALSGDQFVSGTNPITQKSGWWSNVIGPGNLIDTDKYFIICTNVLGGCMGTTGPSSNSADNKIYGLNFPVITIADMVRAQQIMLEEWGIEKLFAIIGGSMGGMQVLEWIASAPDKVFCAVPIATAARHSAQNIAFHEVGRQAIMADPDWNNGNYEAQNTFPNKGLAVARMAAHITYMSDSALHRKFGRNLQNREKIAFGFDADFQIESYLRHQGASFVDRFDANSYLYITRAMDYFDLAANHGGTLISAFEKFKGRACVVSFSSDWHYPPSDSRAIVRAMMAAGVHVSALEVETDKGHDAFLLDEPVFHQALAGFLDAASKDRGL
jgi:homoserine O-acetyltransferase/O-succinyltransferase